MLYLVIYKWFVLEKVEEACLLKQEMFLFTQVGPINPYKTQQAQAVRNTLSGFAEPAHFSRFQFDNQRQTFSSYGKILGQKYPCLLYKATVTVI